jgi:hypothetical protein
VSEIKLRKEKASSLDINREAEIAYCLVLKYPSRSGDGPCHLLHMRYAGQSSARKGVPASSDGKDRSRGRPHYCPKISIQSLKLR